MSTRLVLVKPWNWSTAKVREGAAGVAAPEGVTAPDGVWRIGGEGGPDSRATPGGYSMVAVCVAAILDDSVSDRMDYSKVLYGRNGCPSSKSTHDHLGEQITLLESSWQQKDERKSGSSFLPPSPFQIFIPAPPTPSVRSRHRGLPHRWRRRPYIRPMASVRVHPRIPRTRWVLPTNRKKSGKNSSSCGEWGRRRRGTCPAIWGSCGLVRCAVSPPS